MRNVIRFLLVVLAVLQIGAVNPVYQMASIVRGEAPAGCETCFEVTACTVVREYKNGIHLPSRWYGWRPARDRDIALIRHAMDTDMCNGYPVCRFLGNRNDVHVWRNYGWISDVDMVKEYCNENGCSVCVAERMVTVLPQSSRKAR